MKNLLKGIAMTLTLLIGVSTITPTMEAKAYSETQTADVHTHIEDMPRKKEGRQWGQKVCTGMQNCYGCSATNCKVLKVQKITTSYSYSECVQIVNRTKSFSKTSQMAGIFLGTKLKPIPAAFLSLWGSQISDYSSHFANAVARTEGLTLSYELVIHKTSYSLNQTRNSRITRS